MPDFEILRENLRTEATRLLYCGSPQVGNFVLHWIQSSPYQGCDLKLTVRALQAAFDVIAPQLESRDILSRTISVSDLEGLLVISILGGFANYTVSRAVGRLPHLSFLCQ